MNSALDWTESIDAGRHTDVIYIDVAKAFDSVSHIKLCKKLSSYGIKGMLLDWITSWLYRRSQQVRIDGFLSDFLPVRSGVVQGSNLGPVLYVIFINDTVDTIPRDAHPVLFADDLKIYSDGPFINDNGASYSPVLQQTLDLISIWMDNWQLKLSLNKCNVIRIGCNNKMINKAKYKVNGVELPQVESNCDLGVQVDSNLTFSQHISSLVSKAHQRSGLIRRCFLSRDADLLKRAFNTYIRPIVEYVTPVWCPKLIKFIQILERVQRVFSKHIPSLSGMSYLSRVFALEVDLLEVRRIQADLIAYYKILNGFYPSINPNMIQLSMQTSTRGHPFKLQKSQFHKNSFKFFFSNRSIDIWNGLPLHIVSAGTISAFKARVRRVNLSPYLIGNLV